MGFRWRRQGLAYFLQFRFILTFFSAFLFGFNRFPLLLPCLLTCLHSFLNYFSLHLLFFVVLLLRCSFLNATFLHLRYNELLPILSRLKELEDTQETLEAGGKSRMGDRNHASSNKKKAGR